MDDHAPKTLTEQQAWVRAICDVTGWNDKLNGPRAGKFGKALRAAGATISDLEAHYGQVDSGAAWWWYRDDWRGKRGQRPSQAGINETWGAWTLPIAVETSKFAGVLAYVERAKSGNVG